MPPTTAPAAPEQLERAWTINESLHRLLTSSDPTDWPTVAELADQLHRLAVDEER